MKKSLVVILAAVLILAPVVFSYAETTSGAEYSSPNGHADFLADFLNDQDCIDHTHQVDIPREYRNPMIVSIDNIIHLPVPWLQIRIKPTYDFMNKRTSTHGFGGEGGVIIHWGQGKMAQ